MVHLEMMAALLEALPAGARLVLLGDKDQLASVEAGAVLGDLCRDAQAGRYLPDTLDYALRVADQAVPPQFAAPAGDRPPALAQHTVMLRESRRRSEEHTSELQSQSNLVCRLLLEKKKK